CMVKRRLRTLRDFTTSCADTELMWSILRHSLSKTMPANAARFFARPIPTGLDLAAFSQHRRSRRKLRGNWPGSVGKITQQNGKISRSKAILGILPGPIRRNPRRKESQFERLATRKRAQE